MNDPPNIVSIKATQLGDGKVEFIVICNDPDGDSLNTTLLIDGTTVVPLNFVGPATNGYYYTATVKLSEGKHTYQVIVSDGTNAVASKKKALYVPMDIVPYIVLGVVLGVIAAILALFWLKSRKTHKRGKIKTGTEEKESVEKTEVSEEEMPESEKGYVIKEDELKENEL